VRYLFRDNSGISAQRHGLETASKVGIPQVLEIIGASGQIWTDSLLIANCNDCFLWFYPLLAYVSEYAEKLQIKGWM
jgi:hypothetical protein